MHRHRRTPLITALNEDWGRLVARHRDGHPWSRPDLACYGDLAAVQAAIRQRPDAVLGALLAEATAGDVLAGRAVLQALLGKLILLAAAHPGLSVDDLVAALWCRIRTYPLARRPGKIAANLVLDARKDAFALTASSRRERVVGSFDDRDGERLLRRQAASSDPDRADRQAYRVIETALATGVIDPATSSALQAVYLDGASSRTAAARLGTSAGMVRYRCSRGLRQLARHADSLTDAA